MKKQIIAGMAAAMVCVGAVGGTFAYLTQTTGEVKNTFTVGKNVHISLDEAAVDQYGDAIAEASRRTENSYKLIPDHDYIKDPIVHVEPDSESCYVFIYVKNDISPIEAEAGAEMEDKSTYVKIAEQITNNGWIPVTVGTNSTNYYYYPTAITEDTEDRDLAVFENFMVSSSAVIGDGSDMDLSNYDTLTKGTAITINACAVQNDGFAAASDAVSALPSDFVNLGNGTSSSAE